MPTEIDTTNRCMVSGARQGVALMRPPIAGQILTKAEALNLAAWLVVLGGGREKFLPVLDAVENT